MATTRVLSLSLVVLVLAISASAQFCGMRARRCLSRYAASPELLETGEVETLCSIASDIKTCLGTCMSSPILTTGQYGAIVAILEYVCQPSRRSQMQELMGNECFQGNELESQAEQFAFQCTYTAMASVADRMSDMSAVCPALQGAAGCISERVGSICGDEVIPVFNDLVGIIFRYTVPQFASCFEQVSTGHNMVRRAAKAFFQFMRK